MTSDRTLGDAELLVSELTTNSIRHAHHSELSMEAAVRGDRVRVRVCDMGEGFEAHNPDKPDLDVAGGYGLLLLDRLADDWGVNHGDRFCVWFELERR